MDLPDSFKKRDLNRDRVFPILKIVLKNPDIRIFLPGQSAFLGERIREEKNYPANLAAEPRTGKKYGDSHISATNFLF